MLDCGFLRMLFLYLGKHILRHYTAGSSSVDQGLDGGATDLYWEVSQLRASPERVHLACISLTVVFAEWGFSKELVFVFASLLTILL